MGSITAKDPSFSAPAAVHSFHGLLFDFDGTIVDSTDAIAKYWKKMGKELGVDPNVILATSHGRRSIDVMRLYDEKKANWEYISLMEGLIPKEFGPDAVEIPGARKLLASLDDAGVKWAVVTSGTRALVEGWIGVMMLAYPRYMVVAEDVENGKPAPECYLLGRKRLGLSSESDILVIEDAPAGVRAGKAAGFKVLGLATTHTIDQVKTAGADWIVRDLSSVSLKKNEMGRVSIEIRDALEW